MKKTALILSLALFAAPLLHAAKFAIDASHSDVSFKVRHMMVSKVQGKFTAFSGEFNYEEGKPESWNATAVIETASVNTSNDKRDEHLRNADFFDAQKFPTITFKSTKVTGLKDGKAKLEGLLNMHGVEKPVTLNLEIGGVVQDPWGNTRAGFEATGTINRQDFGIVWNKALSAGGVVVGNEVEISIHVEGVMAKPENAPTKPAKP